MNGWIIDVATIGPLLGVLDEMNQNPRPLPRPAAAGDQAAPHRGPAGARSRRFTGRSSAGRRGRKTIIFRPSVTSRRQSLPNFSVSASSASRAAASRMPS